MENRLVVSEARGGKIDKVLAVKGQQEGSSWLVWIEMLCLDHINVSILDVML